MNGGSLTSIYIAEMSGRVTTWHELQALGGNQLCLSAGKGVFPMTFLLWETYRKSSSFPKPFLAVEKFLSSQRSQVIGPHR